MQLTKCLLLLTFLSFRFNILAQIRWNGGSGDGQWLTPANWEGNAVPTAGDDVLLDNSFVAGSYQVSLPSGDVPIIVRSLTITPTSGYNITVTLPTGNTALPGFSCQRSPYGLVLNNGAIFINASGAPAVANTVTVAIADSLCINNGGRYIHRTGRAHAPILDILSLAPGTEYGVFEFDVPAGSAYAVSLADRIYGSFALSAATATGNKKTYNTTGNKPAMIRGDLILQEGVTYNHGFSGPLAVHGHFHQSGGSFNFSSNATNPLLTIGRDLRQSGGIVQVTNTNYPVIELKGTVPQFLATAQPLGNNITLKINNPAGIVLQSPLTLSYRLELINGTVTSSATNLLTLEADCSIQADTLVAGSFINGPVRKQGLNAAHEFLFPVGKGDAQRWMSLSQATGSYTVEFFRGNPRLMSSSYQSTLHHVSGIEYWSIQAGASPAAQAQVKLSFNDPNSGGVTDLSALRVAQLSGGSWVDAGHTGSGGTAGSNGFVTSHLLTSFGPAIQYFTLASTSGSFNPLLLHPRTPSVRDHGISLTGLLQPSITSHSTQLVLTAGRKRQAQVLVMDGTGRIIKRLAVTLQRGRNTIAIDVALLPAGMYMIALAGQELSMTPLRFIKQ